MRYHCFILVLSAFAVAGAIATPTSQNHVRLEQRSPAAARWLQPQTRAPPDTELAVRIGITQRNLHLGHDRLMEISDPRSPRYGRHMSAKEVGDLFRPSNKSMATVRDWLHNSGIASQRHLVSSGWLRFNATVAELESLLRTQYHVYQHEDTGDEHIGCDEYHVPLAVHEHIDFVTPAVSTVVKIASRGGDRRASSPVDSAAFPPHLTVVDIDLKAQSHLPCYAAVTPDCLRSLYDIPMGTKNYSGNNIGIFEYADVYDQPDLDRTFTAVAPYVPNGTHPLLEGINGGTAPTTTFPGGLESLLDMAIILPLVYPQSAVLYQVDDRRQNGVSSGFGDTFLDALDASFCTFDGGDDPTLDPHYPDTGPPPQGQFPSPVGTWPYPEMCGAYTPANVISISYGLGEGYFSYHYQNRQCQEYLKLGLQGVSVIYSSGDSGVSNRGECLHPAGQNITGPGAFSPTFPASCPYVTTVGATQIDDKAGGLSEIAVDVSEDEYWSGGGFSNFWPTPDYQESTIASYFANSPPSYNLTSYGTPYYNKSGRAYPDVSAIGENITLYSSRQPTLGGGTSASAPIFASIINLIIGERIAAGKGPVGFLNPVLYQNPDAFTDITVGHNPGCGTDGFSAVKGWDPVTGLGSPKFPKLLEVFMALP